MRVVEITSCSDLDMLRPGWEALWERCPDAGPFAHPDWLLPWWKHLGGGELWTVAVVDAGRLAALAPMFIYRYPQSGMRQLTLLGNGISDRLDILAEPEAPGAATLMADHVRGCTAHWDTCDFRDLPPHAALFPGMADGDSAVVTDDAPCPVLDLTGARDDLAGTAPTRLLYNLRNAWQRACALGDAGIERADAGSLPQALDALFQLHSARWASQGSEGVLSQSAVEAFHREVASRFLARGWLRLYLLRTGARVVAAHYGFHLRGRAYYYIGGFDPRFSELSPGALLIRHAIAEAVREGACAFDFLRGGEPYKYRWGARDQPQFRLQLAAPSCAHRTPLHDVA